MASEISLPKAQSSESEYRSGTNGKKRRREETQDQPTTPGDETPAKKQKKKSRAERESNVTAAARPTPDTEDRSSTKLRKKDRKRERELGKLANDSKSLPSTIPDPLPSNATQDWAVHDETELEKSSPLIKRTISLFLALSPVSHNFPLEGACAEHVSPLLLTYYPPLNGVLLSYNNPRLSEHPEEGAHLSEGTESTKLLGKNIDEYAVTYVWLTAEFLLFRPDSGKVLEGYISLQNESILGLLCYNYFNAGIERARLPKDWRWVDGEAAEDGDRKQRNESGTGRYFDGRGNEIEGRVIFKVKDFEATAGADGTAGNINIYGTLLPALEDARIDDDLRQKSLVRDTTGGWR